MVHQLTAQAATQPRRERSPPHRSANANQGTHPQAISMHARRFVEMAKYMMKINVTMVTLPVETAARPHVPSRLILIAILLSPLSLAYACISYRTPSYLNPLTRGLLRT